MIVRSLWRRPVRSLLTILGIAIGVASIVALSAMAQGFVQNYGGVLRTSNALLVTQASAYDPSLSSLSESLGARIRAIGGVENVDPGVFTYITAEGMPYMLVFGYEPGSVAAQHYRITSGRPVGGSRQLAIGRRAAAALRKGIDDTLRIYGVPYRIVAIYETGQGMEESGVLVTLSDAQAIVQKIGQVSLYQVGLRASADIAAIMQRIGSLDKQLTVSRATEYQSAQQWGSLVQAFAWGVAAIAILIGGLGMMNAMMMSVLERTREIGTLRALGWSRRRVMRLILGESLVVSLLGGTAGAGLGVGLVALVARDPGVGAFVEGAFSPGLFGQALATAVGLGLVGGAYPAWKAAGLRPSEALRYEGGGAGEAGRWLSRLPSQSLRNLWRRRTRTIISAAGVGTGTAILVMLGGLILGFTGELNMLAGSGGTGSLTVMQKGLADMSLSSLDERLASGIQSLPGVASASPLLWGFISTPEMPLFVLQGLDPNSAAMAHYRLAEGRFIQRPDEVLVGQAAASNYKLGVGGILSLYSNRYRIVGVYETGVPFEEGGGILSLREAQRLLNAPRTISFVFVNVVDNSQARTVRAAIERRYPDVQASLSSEFAQNSADITRVASITDAVGWLALLVGGIVVANTMFMSIHERTREIGTLRALGWRKLRVLGQILQECMLLCLLAAVGGGVIGALLLWGLTHLPGMDAFLTPRLDAGICLRAVATTLLVGLAGGLLPAWHAGRLHPVEALRYE